jgi:hypothetical protein
MAGVVRELASTHDYWHEWRDFVKDSGLELSTRNADVERRAKKSGRTVEQELKLTWDTMAELRREFDGIASAKREVSAQAAMVRNNSLDSTCSVFQRADRILTGLTLNVQLSDEDTPTPAWNNGKTITFNSSAIKEIDDNTILSLHGLNYHEVAHLLFSPRVGTVLGKWVNENRKYLMAFNVLEDCRAEYYLSLKYPSVRPFLSALLGDYILDNGEQLDDSFILLGGRRYFNRAVRQMSARKYAEKYGEEQAQKVYAILSEYRSLVYPSQYARGQELIKAFTELLESQSNNGEGDKHEHSASGCTMRPVLRNGKPMSEKAQKALLDSDPNKVELPFEFTDEWTEEGNGDLGERNEKTANWRDKDETLMEQVKSAIELAKSDNAVQNKVRETSKAIAKSNGAKPILNRIGSTKTQPTQNEIMASRLFGQELERIRIDSDPAWEREKPSGKLNVRRAMHSDINDYGKLFDRWETGNDDYDIEACILIDRSGSMWSEIGSVCRSAWIIKRGVEKINGRVTLMTFNDASHILSHADERAKADTILEAYSSGGTNPYYALLEAERVFSQSTRATKLLFLLTDGGFSTDNDRVIERMNSLGVHTNLVYLTSSEQYALHMMKDRANLEERSHKAQDFRAISKPSDLLTVAKDVVRHQLRTVGK